jgi:hypothetical protein
MCTGHCYDLLCEHKLIHYATRCEKMCEIPEGPHWLLRDTCAPCTPSFQVTNINRKYDRLQVVLRAQYMEAIRLARERGDGLDEEGRLTKVAAEQAAKQDAERRKELAVVAELERRLSGDGARVAWPGKEADRETTGSEDDFRGWK